MNTKINLEKGSDEMHAFLELMLDGVQKWLDEARKAMDINCEEAVPGALRRMRENSTIVDQMMTLAKDLWDKVDRVGEEAIVIGLNGESYGRMLLALKEGIMSRVDVVLKAAEKGNFRDAAVVMQDLGEAMKAASDVFFDMEEEKGGEA